MYRLRLLGGAELEEARGDTPGRVVQRHPLALLALLSVAGDRGVSRDRLVAFLWPESPSAAARHRLSDTLYALRQELGDDAVLATGGTLQVNQEAVRADVLDFEAAMASGEPARAVRLYGGPFLQGFHVDSRPFEEWLAGHRARLADLFAGAVETLARGAEGAGDPARAAGWWERLLMADPYRSPVALRLMESLIAAGDPARAIQHARDHTRLLREELGVEPPPEITALVRRLRGARPPDEIRSVAVLPFVNVNGDPDTEYFSDGVTYDIINHLAKIADLKVVSGTSSARYKGSAQPLQAIGAALGVGTIVEGEVQRVEDRVRINAQLIDARTDEHLWAEQYDRRLDDVFAIQSAVAQQVARGLRATLTAEERKRIEAPPTGTFEAYNLYLKGRSHWARRGVGLRTALGYFRRALDLDPDYALAHAGMADCYTLLGWFGQLPALEAFPRGSAAATRALEANPELAEAHATLGFVRALYDGRPREGQAELLRAIELEPGYAPAHYFLAAILLMSGQPDEAVARSRHALDLDPFSPFVNAHVGWMLIGAARYGEAIDQLERALELDPASPMTHWLLGWASVYAYGPGSAIPHFENAVQNSSRDPWFLAFLGWASGLAGRPESGTVLEELEARSGEQHVRPLCRVLVHLGRNEVPQAMEWLERAYEARDPWLAAVGLDPAFDRLRSEPRFAELAEETGIPWADPET